MEMQCLFQNSLQLLQHGSERIFGNIVWTPNSLETINTTGELFENCSISGVLSSNFAALFIAGLLRRAKAVLANYAEIVIKTQRVKVIPCLSPKFHL